MSQIEITILTGKTPSLTHIKYCGTIRNMTHIELPASKLEVGHHIIVNDFDRPCTRLVARIMSIDGNWVNSVYISKSLNREDPCSSTKEDAVPINNFGYRVESDGTSYRCTPDETLPKTAIYSDTLSPRSWQREKPDHTSELLSTKLDKLPTK